MDLDYFERLDPRSPTGDGTHPEQIGTLTHELIAAIARRYGGAPSPADVLELASKFDFGRFSSPIRMARRQRAVTLAGAFFSYFGRPGWSVVGSEVVVGEVALDLLWEKAGALEADEVKTGSRAAAGYLNEAKAQAQGQAEVARQYLGEAFRGVRLVLLKAPSTSLTVSPKGVWT